MSEKGQSDIPLLTFKADLWDSFFIVTKSEYHGIQNFKDAYHYWKKRAQIEEEYSKSLFKLHQKTFTSSSSSKKEKDKEKERDKERDKDKDKEKEGEQQEEVEASGQSIAEAWESVEKAAQAEGQTHSTFAAAILELVVSPSKLLIRGYEEKLKLLQMEGQRAINEQQQHIKNLEKARANFQKLNKEAENAKVAWEEAKHSKEAPKLEKKMQKLTQEAENAENEFLSQETAANNFLQSYYSDLMPRIMEELEKLDNSRLVGMSTQMQKYSNLLEEVPKRVSFAIKPVLAAIGAVNVEQDVQKFIKKYTTDTKPPTLSASSDLGNSALIENEANLASSTGSVTKSKNTLAKNFSKKIRAMRSGTKSVVPPTPVVTQASTPTKVSIFGLSLDDIMKRQEDKAPFLEIPLPLVSLAHAIMSLGGTTTEGVFRVPAPASELVKLIKQFDDGNYFIDLSPTDTYTPPSVHCIAGALKKLLRETPEPLVPTSMYESAISAETLGSAEAMLIIVASLPPLNRKVLLFLVRYLQEFLHPECVAMSKMGTDNIAMVFAPTVLRTSTEDLNVMVANAQREKAFVRMLLENIQPSYASWAMPGEVAPQPEDLSLSSSIPLPSFSPLPTVDALQAMLDSVFSPSTPFFSSSSPSHSPTAFLLDSTMPALSSSVSTSSSILVSNNVKTHRKSHSFAEFSPPLSGSPPGSSNINVRDRSWSGFSEGSMGSVDIREDSDNTPELSDSENKLVEFNADKPHESSNAEHSGPNDSVLEAEVSRLKSILVNEKALRTRLEEEKRRLQAEAERAIYYCREEARRELEKELEKVRKEAEIRIEKTKTELRKENEHIQQEKEKAQQDMEQTKVEAEKEREEAARMKEEIEILRQQTEREREEAERREREIVEVIEKREKEAIEIVEKKERELAEMEEIIVIRVKTGPIFGPISVSRDKIALELVFLSDRIANSYDYPLLLELSKIVRQIRQGLDSTALSAALEEWQIPKLVKVYNIVFPPIDIGPVPPRDPPTPANMALDLEKLRKMRMLASQANQSNADLLCALVVHSILCGNASGQTIQIQVHLDEIASKLLTADSKALILRKEAFGLVAVIDSLAASIKEAFHYTPVDKLVDLARPIIALVKDLDIFFAWAGMEVPPLTTPPTDDGITDDRLKRVRSMLFAALNKVVAQAKILQMSMHEAPSNDPRLVPMLERIHLIVSALQTSASLPTQQLQHSET